MEPELPGPQGDDELIDAIEAHIDEFLGEPDVVYHEEESHIVHIDAHVLFATDHDDATTLVTSGMSARAMNVPGDVPEGEKYRYTELALHLPFHWPQDWETLRKPENWWPIQTLFTLARLPHDQESWVWAGHTMANGEPPQPYAANTRLCAALVTPCFLLPEEFETMDRPGGGEITFHNVAFIFPEELEFCREHGSDAFFDRCKEAGLSPFELLVVDRQRRNVCRPSRRHR